MYYGFRGEVWTCTRVAGVIREEFGVSYHPAHVSRLVRALGLSLQKPARRANQRDEEAIERCKEERWPKLKKGLYRGGPDQIVFVDESGFYLLPSVVRTYALVGKTPVLYEQLSREQLSAISAITEEGKLYMMEQDRALKGADVVRFLKHLLRRLAGKLLVVWDGSPRSIEPKP